MDLYQMGSNTSSMPPNAAEVLFAEDLINRVLYRHSGSHYKTWRAGPYRDFIYNGFNEEIQAAVDFIDMMLEWEIDEEFAMFTDMEDVNENAFINYAVNYGLRYFPDGFDAGNFLYYCVRLVSLASYFIQHNVQRAPDLALYFILKAFEGYDMFEGGWDTLNNIAKKYIKQNACFCKVLTPDVSDDELQENEDMDHEDMDQSEEDKESCLLNKHDGLITNQPQTPKEEPVYEIDDLSTPKDDLGCRLSSESMESKTDSKFGLLAETQTSLGESVLNVAEAPRIASTQSGKKNCL